MPAHSNVKHIMTMWYLNETERKEIYDLNEAEYQRQMEFEKEHPEFFSWAFFYDFAWNWKFTKYYFMYSWETFWDAFAILLTFACGIYTFGLMVQTLYYAKNQTSMIDDMKFKVMIKDRKKHRAALQEYFEKSKRRRVLSLTELWQLVFGESTLLCFHTWIPIYRVPRTMDQASEEFLLTFEENEKKFK